MQKMQMQIERQRARDGERDSDMISKYSNMNENVQGEIKEKGMPRGKSYLENCEDILVYSGCFRG